MLTFAAGSEYIGSLFSQIGISPQLKCLFLLERMSRDVPMKKRLLSKISSYILYIRTMNNKKNFLKELRISIEICEPETFVKVKAHERLVNGKVVKIRSHYRRILGKGEKE